MTNEPSHSTLHLPCAASSGGLFLAIEGGEGSGKSRQVGLLAGRFQSLGCPLFVTREPGGTPVAEAIRGLLLNTSLTPAAELFLIAAARAEHVARVISPALHKGEIVICDRFFGSTLAYQGFGLGMDRDLIERINELATGSLTPNLSIILDVPVALGQARISHEGRGGDAIEGREQAFHQRVREGFVWLAERRPEQYVRIDGTPPVEHVHDAIWVVLKERGLLPAAPLER